MCHLLEFKSPADPFAVDEHNMVLARATCSLAEVGESGREIVKGVGDEPKVSDP